MSLLEITPAALHQWYTVRLYFRRALLILRNDTDDAAVTQNARVGFWYLFCFYQTFLVCCDPAWIIPVCIFKIFFFSVRFCFQLVVANFFLLLGQNDKHCQSQTFFFLSWNSLSILFVVVLFWLSLVECPCYCYGLSF